MLNKTLILPVVVMILSLAASAVYFCAGNWRQGLYWLAGATLTATQTF